MTKIIISNETSFFRTATKFLFFEWVTIAGETRFFGRHSWREEKYYSGWEQVYWIKND